jgi:hypothetical protein
LVSFHQTGYAFLFYPLNPSPTTFEYISGNVDELVNLNAGFLSEAFPTPYGKTGKPISYGGGYDVVSVVMDVGRDSEGLYWEFRSTKKGGDIVSSTLRWDERTLGMVAQAKQTENKIRRAYRELKLGERRPVSNIEDFVRPIKGVFLKNSQPQMGSLGNQFLLGVETSFLSKWIWSGMPMAFTGSFGALKKMESQ